MVEFSQLCAVQGYKDKKSRTWVKEWLGKPAMAQELGRDGTQAQGGQRPGEVEGGRVPGRPPGD